MKQLVICISALFSTFCATANSFDCSSFNKENQNDAITLELVKTAISNNEQISME